MAIRAPFRDAVAGDADWASRLGVFNNVLSNDLKNSPNILAINLNNCDLPFAPVPVNIIKYSPNNTPDIFKANIFKT